LLLDRIKAEEMFKRQDALQEERSKMSKTKLKKLERKKDIQFRKRQTKRDKLKVEEREKEMQEARDTEAMEEFQRLAAGGGPEAKTS
jgi:hypothetical protein